MRPALPVPSLALGASLLFALAACTGMGGRVTAQWGRADSVSRMQGAAVAVWCAEQERILVQATDRDRAVGFSWHFAALHPDSIPLSPGGAPDSIGTRASAALRDIRGQDLRGYQSISGLLRVTEVDSTHLSAHVDASMLRVGRVDTVPLTAEFRNVALTRDTTLCSR